MKTLRFALPFCLLFGAMSCGAVTYGQEPKHDDSHDVSTIEAYGEIEAISQGNLRSQVRLGALQANQEHRIRLTLANATDEIVGISRASSSCGCVRVRSPKGQIEPGGSFNIELTVAVGKSLRQPEQNQSITLFDLNGKGLTVAMSYEVAGLLTFGGRGVTVKVPEGATSHTFEIPLITSPPVQFSKLEIGYDEELGVVDAKLVESPVGKFVQLRCAYPGGIRKGRSGAVWVKDAKASTTDRVACMLQVREPVELSPLVLRFTQSPEDIESGEFTASAICRIARSELKIDSTDSEHEKEIGVSLSAHCEFGNLTLKSKRLSVGIYRLYLTWNPTAVDSSALERPEEIFFKFHTGKRIVRSKTRAQFSGVSMLR